MSDNNEQLWSDAKILNYTAALTKRHSEQALVRRALLEMRHDMAQALAAANTKIEQPERELAASEGRRDELRQLVYDLRALEGELAAAQERIKELEATVGRLVPVENRRLPDRVAKLEQQLAAKEAEAAYWNHHYNELMLESHNAALAVVRKMRQQPTVPLDAPDSPGWWAWEEGNLKGVSEVYEGISKELIVSDEPGGLGAWYFSGRKWYRLTMPWDAQPKEGGSDAIKDND